MNKILTSIRNNINKASLILLLALPITFFLNTGFSLETYWKAIQGVLLAIVLTTILIWPDLRKTFFWIALILIIIMALFYIVRMIEWAEIIGSTGIGLIMINLLSYLPQLVKLGYIKKL